MSVQKIQQAWDLFASKKIAQLELVYSAGACTLYLIFATIPLILIIILLFRKFLLKEEDRYNLERIAWFYYAGAALVCFYTLCVASCFGGALFESFYLVLLLVPFYMLFLRWKAPLHHTVFITNLSTLFTVAHVVLVRERVLPSLHSIEMETG